jgi:hypothetical protein
MSTDYFVPCEDCINKIEHIHRASDYPVAHTYFGGERIGLQLNHKDYLADDMVLISEYGSLHKLSDIKENVGKGKK